VLELKSFDPSLIPDLIASVVAQGYSTLIIDSLSHFWNGAGGELDQVERMTARSKSNNSWAAWREVSPKHNRMIDLDALCTDSRNGQHAREDRMGGRPR